MHAITFGSPTSIKAELDTSRAYIGDPLSWRIFVEAGKNERVEFPEINIANELLDITSIKQITDQNSGRQIGVEFEIVAWDTGKFQTPSYSAKISFSLDFIDSVLCKEYPIRNEIKLMLKKVNNFFENKLLNILFIRSILK